MEPRDVWLQAKEPRTEITTGRLSDHNNDGGIVGVGSTPASPNRKSREDLLTVDCGSDLGLLFPFRLQSCLLMQKSRHT